MPEIELDHVSKRFPDGTDAVRDVSLAIREGEFFILVGPSGCGKSTLLNMIVGLERPTAGEIRVAGERVDEIDARDRNMAMVFQSYALYPHMTVRENLAFPLRVARRPRDEIDARVRRAAAMLELEELLDRRPASLSGGQRQRVAMGRAVVREPAAFLLDEPLSNLDARLRVQMRTEIARLQKRLGTTTVYVTHDQTEAMTLGDRVAVLRGGALQQVGTPRELYRAPRNLFVAGFIGSPGMNFLPATLEDGELALPVGRVGLPAGWRRSLGPRRGPLIAGIRPEHLRDAARTGANVPGLRFAARVEVREWLGADLHLHCVVDGGAADALGRLPAAAGLERAGRDGLPLVARVGSERDVAEDASIELALDPARLHLFDAETGERLCGEPPQGSPSLPLRRIGAAFHSEED